MLNGTPPTNILAPPPTFNTYSYSSQPSFSSITSTNNPQISSNLVQLNPSPIKSSNNTNNNDVTVHYIGGYVIRESNHPFSSSENLNQKENNEQIRCIMCQKIDYSQKFFDQVNKFCSKLCAIKSNENKIPIINEPIRVNKKVIFFFLKPKLFFL